MSIIQQLEDLKEWSQDSTRYERRLAFRNQSMPGGLGTEAGTIPIEFDELSDREIEYYRTGPWSTREDYSKGQLVQPGPGRQGYAGKKTKTPRQEEMTWLTQAQVKAMKKNLPDGIYLVPDSHIKGQYNYSFNLEKDRGTKKHQYKQGSLRATPENLEKLIELREVGVKEMFPDRLTNREFKRFRFLPENISKTNAEFAKVINDLGYKTRGGGGKQGPGKFTAFTVKDQQVRLGISNDVGNLAKVARKKSEVLKLIRESSGGKELLQIYNWDKYEKMLRNRASQIVQQDMIAKSTGRFPSGSTNEHKLWNSFYRATDQGDRIKIVGEFADGNLPRDADGYVDWYKKNKKDVPAWKRIEFVDTEAPKGKQKFKWGGLKGQVDNAFGSGFFTRNTKGYDLAALDSQRMFKGEKIGTLVRDKMLMKELKNNIFKSEGIRRQPTKLEIDEFMTRRKPGFAMSEGHHIEGVGKNPYKVEPAFQVANRKLGALARSYKLGKIDKATFIKKINELPGGIRYKVDDILEGTKTSEVSRVKAAVKASGFNKNTANQIFKTYQKMGIGTKCQWKGNAEGGRIGFAAGGYDDCMNNAIKEHNKNLKSKDLTVRNEARAKQFNINKTKNMKSLMSLGARGGKNVLKLGRTWGIELEPIFEGGFYEYARRKGYTHEQAKEETFFWKMLDPSTKTGLLEGAEPLLEKELYEIKGEEEFMDVDNRPPMQDPEFGQVIGERKSVKRYVENEKALAAAYDKYNQLYTAHQVATTGRETDPEKAEQLMTASENLWEEIKGLEKQLNYDRDMYQAAVEKQQTEQGLRAIEYGEYGQGDTPELARRREEERYRLMNEKFPGYQKADMDQRLENWGVYIDPNLRSYKGRTVQRPEGLEYIGKPVLNPDAQRGWTYDDFSDYLKDQDKMAYFAENFRTEKAGGGIAGIRRPWAIPPESGPDPQGIIPRPGYQQGNRVNPFEETGNLPGGAYDAREYIKSPILNEDKGITTVEAPPRKRTIDEIVESVVGKAKDRPKHYKLDEEGNIIIPRAGPMAGFDPFAKMKEVYGKIFGALDLAQLNEEQKKKFWTVLGVQLGLEGEEIEALTKGKEFLNKEHLPLYNIDDQLLLNATKTLNLPGNTSATLFAQTNLDGDLEKNIKLGNSFFNAEIGADNTTWGFNVGDKISTNIKGIDGDIASAGVGVDGKKWDVNLDVVLQSLQKEEPTTPQDHSIWRYMRMHPELMRRLPPNAISEKQKQKILTLGASYTTDKDLKISPQVKYDIDTDDITKYGLTFNKGDSSANLTYGNNGLSGDLQYIPESKQTDTGQTVYTVGYDDGLSLGYDTQLKSGADLGLNYSGDGIGATLSWKFGKARKPKKFETYEPAEAFEYSKKALDLKTGGLASMKDYATTLME